MLPSHQVGNFDIFFKNHDITSVAFRNEADLIRHESNLSLTVNDFVTFRDLDESRYTNLPVTMLDPGRWEMVAPLSYVRARDVALQRINTNNPPVTQLPPPLATDVVVSPAATDVVDTGPSPPSAAPASPICAQPSQPPPNRKKAMLQKAAGIRAAKLKARQEQECVEAERVRCEEIKTDAVEKSMHLKVAGIRAAKLKARKTQEALETERARAADLEATENKGRDTNTKEEAGHVEAVMVEVGTNASAVPPAGVASHKMKMMEKITKKRLAAAAASAMKNEETEKGQDEVKGATMIKRSTNDTMHTGKNNAKIKMQAKIAAKRRSRAASAGTGKGLGKGEANGETEMEVKTETKGKGKVSDSSMSVPSAPNPTPISTASSSPATSPSKQSLTSPMLPRRDLLDPELHRGSWERIVMSNIESFPEEGIARAGVGKEIKEKVMVGECIKDVAKVGEV
jgi:hypothetical protein